MATIPIPSDIDIAADNQQAAVKEILSAKYADAGAWTTYGATLLTDFMSDIQQLLNSAAAGTDLSTIATAVAAIELYTAPGTAFTYTAPGAPIYDPVGSYVEQTLGSILDMPAVEVIDLGVLPSTDIAAPGSLTGLTAALVDLPAYTVASTLAYTAPTAPEYATVPGYTTQTLDALDTVPSITAKLGALTAVPAITASAGTLIELPAVEAIDVGAAPATDVDFTNSAFTDTLLDSLKTRLAADITTSSTGLGSAEAALFARETARQNDARAKAYSEITTIYSSRGYDEPPGAMGAKIKEANDTSTIRLADSSSNIMAESARLAVDYNKAVLSNATQLLDLVSRVFDSKIMRDFEAAKTKVQYAIEGFKQLVSVALAKADLNKAAISATVATNDGTVSVYKGLVDAQSTAVNAVVASNNGVISAYTGQIQGESAAVNAVVAANQGKIEAFKAKIEGQVAPMKAISESNSTMAAAFGAAVQSATSSLNAQVIPEELKLKQLASNIQLVGTAVDAYSKAAAIELESSKTKVTLDMEGFKQTTSAALAKAELNKTAITATTAANQGTVEVFTAKIAGQIEPIKAVADANQAKAAAYSAAVQGAKADLEAQTVPEELKLKGVVANSTIAGTKAEIALKEAMMVIEDARRQVELEVQTLLGLAGGAQQIIAGALNGVSVSSSFGFGGSATSSTSHGYNTNVAYKADDGTLPILHD